MRSPSGIHGCRTTRLRNVPSRSMVSSTTSPGLSQPPTASGVSSRMQPVPTVPEPSTSPGRSSVSRLAWASSLRPGPVHRAGVAARQHPAVDRRGHLQVEPAVAVAVASARRTCTSSGPSEVAKSLPLLGPRPTAISARWRSRALQSFMIVKPGDAPAPDRRRAGRGTRGRSRRPAPARSRVPGCRCGA